MDLLDMVKGKKLDETGETKKLSIRGKVNDMYTVYAIPLEYLYYNDQNGRINTAYKKYSSTNGLLSPEPGDSEYNMIFEKFIYESNVQAMKETKQSILDKLQQEPGVVLPDGRVIDGNRRLTALRMIARENNEDRSFNAIILPLYVKSKYDEKIIKELELDLQLGREERVNYDPIDRIFDVYNTIEVEKLMTIDEYKKASGAKNARSINRDIRLAELIKKFIEIVSPGGNPIDKFYLARDLKLDGPIEEIENTIFKLKSKDKEAIKEAVLVYLVSSKVGDDQNDTTRVMRDLKQNVLQDHDRLQYFLKAADEKVDVIMDTFEKYPLKSANELKTVFNQNAVAKKSVESLVESTKNIVNKGKYVNERTKALIELGSVRDSLSDIDAEDFSELTQDERILARDVIKEINDILYRLNKDI